MYLNPIPFSTAPIVIDLGPERVLVIQPGVGFQISRKFLFYVKAPLQALSWNSMLKVFSETFWIAITMMIILMILVLSWFGKKFSLKSIISAKIAITVALLGQTFEEKPFLKVFSLKNLISLVITAKHFFMLVNNGTHTTFFFQDKNHKWSKSIQLFCISFLGAFTFWSYTGILTSLSAVQSFSIPVKSLDDLQAMTNFELYIYGGGSTQTLLEKWAQSPKETDIWRQKAYQKFIKTGLEDDDKLKIIFDEMLNGDISSNVALLNDKDEMRKIFDQSKYDL